jgi:hypothetical protein
MPEPLPASPKEALSWQAPPNTQTTLSPRRNAQNQIRTLPNPQFGGSSAPTAPVVRCGFHRPAPGECSIPWMASTAVWLDSVATCHQPRHGAREQIKSPVSLQRAGIFWKPYGYWRLTAFPLSVLENERYIAHDRDIGALCVIYCLILQL